MISRFIFTAFRSKLTQGSGHNLINLPKSFVNDIKCLQPHSLINHSAIQHPRFNSTLISSMHFPIKTNSSWSKSTTTLPIFNSVNTSLKLQSPARGIIRYNRSRGKRGKVRTVLKRFFRLNWGIWIRTRSARHRKIWTKKQARIRRLRQHVFTNASQSWMLDKMVSPYFRKPKYWVDDPYNPYHSRENFWTTRRKPLP
ncbi:hypothetical protein G9C98_008584 [Cotesia typhae]|uniref:Large ribosomal subunit protein bL35m n=1 Tax=Cotesia typhae TaxID=2053667 RepID=A0A8J5QWY7_9HYME|nr:hypothetical protein G9C98_008584 [Cotesia typhae]